VYQSVLPRNQHPWVYLSLGIDPAAIDVNVHPTKMEVQFLHEETIAQRLQNVLASQLRSSAGSRTFATSVPGLNVLGDKVQFESTSATVHPLVTAPGPKKKASTGGEDDLPKAKQARAEAPSATPVLNPVRVRTDHRQLSLESVFKRPQASQPAASQVSASQPQESQLLAPQPREAAFKPAAGSTESTPEGAAPTSEPAGMPLSEQRLAAFEEARQLTSVEELREAVKLVGDEQLSKTMHQSVFVGPASRELVLIQCGASLCLANLAVLARECAYQRLLRLIGGIGSIMLAEPQPLLELLKLGILDPDSGYDPSCHSSVDIDALAARFVDLLREKAELLNEYFMLDIDVERQQLRSVPNGLGLSSDTGLCFDCLPLFLVRLCMVNWEEEKECLDGICQATADFSVELLLPSEEEEAAGMSAASRQKAAQAAAEAMNASVEAGEFEDVASAAAAKRPRLAGPQDLQGLRWLHEAIRRDGSCCWPRKLTKDGTVLDLVSLDNLYKIFERC